MSTNNKNKTTESKTTDKQNTIVDSIASKVDLEKIKNFDISEKIPFLETLFSKRICAAFVDVICVFFVVIVLSIISFILPGKFMQCCFMFIACLIGAALIALKDGPHNLAIFNYKSPGRAFLGLSIMDLNRNRITYMMSIKRNLCLASLFVIQGLIIFFHGFGDLYFIATILLQMLIFFPLGWIIYELVKLYKSQDNRRPGDILAGTIVELF